MTSYRRQTVREIRKLRFPEQLAEIERRRYRPPDCLAAFLDVCDEIVFQDPSLAMLVTREAPPYVDRVFAADGGGPFRIAWTDPRSMHGYHLQGTTNHGDTR